MRTLMMVTAVVYAVGSYSFGGATMAQGSSAGAAKNVVLVHGAFADDSSWSKVVPLLKAKGLRVTAASNPLTSFADDVAAAKRAIAAQDGPTVLVGHSYGGVVITEAGNDPKVVSLVYVAAFTADAGQSIGEISQAFAKPAGADHVMVTYDLPLATMEQFGMPAIDDVAHSLDDKVQRLLDETVPRARRPSSPIPRADNFAGPHRRRSNQEPARDQRIEDQTAE